MARIDKMPDRESAVLVQKPAEIGAAIRTRRKELGYTQEFCAEMLGYSPRLIGEIERGRGSVGFEKILRYSMGLGMDIIIDRRGPAPKKRDRISDRYRRG